MGVVLLLIGSAYFPFAWDPPRTVRNDVARDADGSLRFGGMNNARTTSTPAWLSEVRRSGIIQIRLKFAPQSLREQASIMMLASNFWDTDFAIGQSGSSLLVWLRRPGSDSNGDPAFVIGRILRRRRWNNVEVMLHRSNIRIRVDGGIRLSEHLPADFAQTWGHGQLALGDEVHGGSPWQGKIGVAEVRAPGYAVDYVRPGALFIPSSYLYFPDHIEPFPPTSLEEWPVLFLELLSFILVGLLISWSRSPPVRIVPAALLGIVLAVALAAGKFLFHARHIAVADIVAQAAGALLGAWLASWLAHAKRSAGGQAPPAAAPPGTSAIKE